MNQNESFRSRKKSGIIFKYTDKRSPFEKKEAERELIIHAKHLDEIKGKESSKIMNQFKRKGET